MTRDKQMMIRIQIDTLLISWALCVCYYFIIVINILTNGAITITKLKLIINNNVILILTPIVKGSFLSSIPSFF